jgi:hypothetical protein
MLFAHTTRCRIIELCFFYISLMQTSPCPPAAPLKKQRKNDATGQAGYARHAGNQPSGRGLSAVSPRLCKFAISIELARPELRAEFKAALAAFTKELQAAQR